MTTWKFVAFRLPSVFRLIPDVPVPVVGVVVPVVVVVVVVVLMLSCRVMVALVGGLNQLAGEFSDLKHERGVVSTVSIPGNADSDGAQFLVCIAPQAALDGKFSAFGRVTEGMDVVEKISQSPNAADGFAEKPVRILKVTIEKKKVEPFAGVTLDELRRTVTVNTTLGTIKIKMEPDWAPNHVRNFLKLTATGWYNGTAFHRMVKDFMVQGGMGNT